MSFPSGKPQHNVFDNIWEIRKTGYPTKEQVKEVLEEKPMFTDMKRIGKAVVFRGVNHFIRRVLAAKSIRLPVWKIIVPMMAYSSTAGEWLSQGSIYYCSDILDIHDNEKCYIFRGTYGYGGTGPHESAMIETIFEMRGLRFELRDGSYLLGFFDGE